MRRIRLSFLIPVLASGAAGAFVGEIVARVSCAGQCAGATVFFISLVSGLIAASGVGIVTVLALRSISEWRQQQGNPTAEPSPPPAEEKQ